MPIGSENEIITIIKKTHNKNKPTNARAPPIIRELKNEHAWRSFVKLDVFNLEAETQIKSQN